jgi:signal peptidase I
VKIAVEPGGEAARIGGEHSSEIQTEVLVPTGHTAPLGISAAPKENTATGTPAAAPVHRHGLLQAFQSLINIVVVALFIMTFTVQPFRIPSSSMEPTLLVGDFLLVDKQVGAEVPPHIFPSTNIIQRGDLIVFHYPVDSSLHLVKRVIGLPGDRIRLRNGRTYINGNAITEPYAVYRAAVPDSYRDNFPLLTSADPGVDSRWWIEMPSFVSNGELTVPPDKFFVLGDNRNDSEDSRYWGFVPRSAIVGKPFLIYFSLNDASSASGQTAAAAMPGNGSERHAGPAGSVVDFARWDRAMRIIH